MKDHQILYSKIKKLTGDVKAGRPETDSRKSLIKFLKCTAMISTPELLKLAETKYAELSLAGL
jgi:hypothetical protein